MTDVTNGCGWRRKKPSAMVCCVRGLVIVPCCAKDSVTAVVI